MMKTKRYIWAPLLLAFAVASTPGAIAVHDEDDGDPFFKIGKNGQVNFSTDVWFGDLQLKKGKYILQHRIDGTDHIFDFLDLKGGQKTVIRSKSVFPGDRSPGSVIHAKEEKDRSVHATKIEMAGENMDHTF